MSKKQIRTVSLGTDFELDNINKVIPFAEYPRPMLRRDSYICLNGEWDLCIKNGETAVYNGKITVPFPPESRISGVERGISKDDLLIYERELDIPADFIKSKTVLHFGACDQYTEVFVNGASVGKNTGGYLPFSFDITKFITAGKNTIKVIASDPLDINLPYGKQTFKRGGMWYTKVSGIWQTVWLESVPENHIEKLKLTPDLNGVDIEVIGGANEKTIVFEGKSYNFSGLHFRLDVENPVNWTPDQPKLYDISVISGEDKVSSYFALRTVEIKKVNGKPFICINGKPMFFHGLLDQGYFSDGIFLPASERGFEEDIIRIKECGFDMLRKHIKLEPEIFYYYCDKHGMFVFQDMINNGKYNFFVDTALPTIGLRKGIKHKVSQKQKDEFIKTSIGIIDQLYNHPSVIYYTIFNEGWGQFDADGCYDILKPLDKTRVFDSTSGWFTEKKSDVKSEHIYFKPIKLKPDAEKPLVLSEFGGYSHKAENHCFNLDKNYGYRYFADRAEFEKALIRLYETEVCDAIKTGLCAAVLTQISDVEDETNGLLTYDRKVLKVDSEKMRTLSEKLHSEFENNM